MHTKSPRSEDVKVGQRIRAARLIKKMSQEKLGEALGLTFQQVQKYEKGANRIGASRMIEIAHALGTTVASLVGETAGGTSALELPMMATALGQRLALAFGQITEHHSREALVRIAETIADKGEPISAPPLEVKIVRPGDAALAAANGARL